MPKSINDGGPAFPGEDKFGKTNNLGMSLRDYFAGIALQALIGHIEKPTAENADKLVVEITRAAYSLADAMIQERTITEN